MFYFELLAISATFRFAHNIKETFMYVFLLSIYLNAYGKDKQLFIHFWSASPQVKKPNACIIPFVQQLKLLPVS